MDVYAAMQFSNKFPSRNGWIDEIVQQYQQHLLRRHHELQEQQTNQGESSAIDSFAETKLARSASSPLIIWNGSVRADFAKKSRPLLRERDYTLV